jgi:hypothetical protein
VPISLKPPTVSNEVRKLATVLSCSMTERPPLATRQPRAWDKQPKAAPRGWILSAEHYFVRYPSLVLQASSASVKRARLLPGGLPLGQLISRRPRACGANQPIRLFQNVGIFRLFSRKKADHHERRAKQQAYQHDFPIGAPVCTVKRTRHKSPLTQRCPVRC